jgi:MYXO-CTERM domain-containing protein
VCCDEACTGPCRRCGKDGTCAAVVSQDDDTCAGTCNAAGACKKKSGETCVVSTDCASEFCVDGVCCESACSGACDVCNLTRGKCLPAPAGDRGSPSCSPLLCDGITTACPPACSGDEDCADGFGCDRPTGACVSGARVNDCAFPSVCDEVGRCITPPSTTGSTCAVVAAGSAGDASPRAPFLALTFAAMLVLRRRRR